jgi:hypothetical protein
VRFSIENNDFLQTNPALVVGPSQIKSSQVLDDAMSWGLSLDEAAIYAWFYDSNTTAPVWLVREDDDHVLVSIEEITSVVSLELESKVIVNTHHAEAASENLRGFEIQRESNEQVLGFISPYRPKAYAASLQH